MTLIRIVTFRRLAAAALLAAAAATAAGCSNDLASFEDTYVPQTPEERYPIRVVDQPTTLTVDVAYGGLQSGAVESVTRFARGADVSARTPVSITFPVASKPARRAADQAAGILAHNGIPRSSIRIASYDGASNVITLSYSTRKAMTKPCGDWSENMRASYTNDDVGTNFGCAYQSNIAAMASNPEDFVQSRKMPSWHYYTDKPAPDASTPASGGASGSSSSTPAPPGAPASPQ